jgi:hypothetical protein
LRVLVGAGEPPSVVVCDGAVAVVVAVEGVLVVGWLAVEIVSVVVGVSATETVFVEDPQPASSAMPSVATVVKIAKRGARVIVPMVFAALSLPPRYATDDERISAEGRIRNSY